MSEAKPDTNEKKESFMKSLVAGLPLFAAFFTVILFAVIGYLIGNFLGTHMGVADLFSSGASSGLYATFYNTTHQAIYNNLAQTAYALGINLYTQDVNVLGATGLGLGLIVGLGIGMKIYEKLD